MIVHIHEHKESINRLVVTVTSLFFTFLHLSHNPPSLLTFLPSYMSTSPPSHTPPSLLTLLPSHTPPFSQPPFLLTLLPSHVNLPPFSHSSTLFTILFPFIHFFLSFPPAFPPLFLSSFVFTKGHCQNSVCHDCKLSLFRLISSLFSDQNPSAPGQHYLCHLLRRWNNQSLGRS